MFDVVLFRPEIPPNTGNAMRLCANTGCTLHLIEPLGFDLDDAKLRRAGMDYRDKATIRVHADLQSWRSGHGARRVFALAKTGRSRFSDVSFEPGDAFLFGPESVGLPDQVLREAWITEVLHIPMLAGVRSLNLSNSVAIVVFEAWRQHGYSGAEQLPS